VSLVRLRDEARMQMVNTNSEWGKDEVRRDREMGEGKRLEKAKVCCMLYVLW
jgi:hypothetical protein